MELQNEEEQLAENEPLEKTEVNFDELDDDLPAMPEPAMVVEVKMPTAEAEPELVEEEKAEVQFEELDADVNEEVGQLDADGEEDKGQVEGED